MPAMGEILWHKRPLDAKRFLGYRAVELIIAEVYEIRNILVLLFFSIPHRKGTVVTRALLIDDAVSCLGLSLGVSCAASNCDEPVVRANGNCA